MTILYYIITIILYCIVLYSIKRDWPRCKVVFWVGNQRLNVTNNNKVMFFVLLHRVQVCAEHHQYNSAQVVFMEE